MEQDFTHKATRIRLLDLRTPQMRAFHVTWFAFFVAFFGWFGIAPLMAVVREDLDLTTAQIGNTIIASVLVTVLARFFFGWLIDRIGPRLAYTWLLALGALPVMFIGLSTSYETFLLFRLAIGVIGASFVITQYHSTTMFAPNVVGTANATTAGWGNLGGGVTQLAMPAVLALVVLVLGVGETIGWRIAMVIPGIVLLVMAFVYYRVTQDAPEGNFADLRARGEMPPRSEAGSFWSAARDPRVIALFLIYGACFGVELTINNVAALYFFDYFDGLTLATAGLIAASFGLMNIFARSLGGILSDKMVLRSGLRGRVRFLFAVLFFEGVALVAFSRAELLWLAIVTLLVFGVLVQMSSGATFAVVPYVNRRALGSVAGIVGAGGSAGAVAFGFLFRGAVSWPTAMLFLGLIVLAVSFAAWLVRFSAEDEAHAASELAEQLRGARATAAARAEDPTGDAPPAVAGA